MKTKKFLIGLLSLACVTAGSFGLVACGDNSAQTSDPTEIEAVYAQYVAYAEEQGQTPLSYETWLSTIKGEKGDKGDQGVGIDKVEYDANGDLLITFTDGRTQTVDVPEQGGQSEGTAGLHYQRIAGKDEYRVMGIGLASELDIVIPSTYNGLPVTEIADRAFCEQEYITSVIIGDSVTSIGYGAFGYCDSLTSMEISNSVTSIGGSAFNGCSSLTSVVIGNSVTSIGKWAFKNCENLTSVVIPASVTSIGEEAFFECYSLANVVIGNGLTSIGESAFGDCIGLKSVVIPDSVTSIERHAFSYCENLTSVVIGNGVTSIGDDAFRNCSSLTSIQFKGTVAEWNAIEKVSSWNYKVPATEVVCLDGKAAL